MIALQLSLVPDARIERTGPDEATLVCARGRIVLRKAGAGFVDALSRLGEGVWALDALAERTAARDGPFGAGRLVQQVARLRELGLAGAAVALAGARALVQTDAPGAPAGAAPSGGGRWLLSRFAHVRRVGAALALETPLSRRRTYLLPPALGLVGALAAPLSVTEASTLLAAREDEAAAALDLLYAGGLLAPADEDGGSAEDGEGDLALWEFHDLLFHAATRGRGAGRVGGTFRFAGRVPPLPVLRPAAGGRRIPLVPPAADAGGAPAVLAALSGRRSARTFGSEPITVAALGGLLYHAARVLWTDRPQPERLPDFVISYRPYPGGGGVHPLEVYALVDRCEGLEPGLYRYDPGGHALEALDAPAAEREALFADAAAAAGGDTRPHVLLVLAARFGRMTWKYEGVAYALLLKEVGALMQTIQLAAEALGLASCPLGFGDADRFAAAAGLGYLVEGSVGEIMLGSRPDPAGGAAS